MTRSIIRIAAAAIEDGHGRMLLVRKSGTKWFMQAGGKIEPGETPLVALCRELEEEIGLLLPEEALRHLGTFTAPAANEPGSRVEADLFHVRAWHVPTPSAEIAEALWASLDQAARLPLAPLTRDHVLPILQSMAMRGD